jgi:hypothetical protein
MKKQYYFGLFALLAFVGIASAATTSALLPLSDGSNTAFTPSSGTTHYTLVDETTCNGNTDYNSTNVVGNRDSYNVSVSSIPNGSIINSVSITPCASRNSNGGGSSTLNVFYILNGTSSSDSGNYALSGTNPSNLASTNINVSQIVKSPATTLQIGAIYSAGTKGAKLSRISATVNYSPLPVPNNFTSSTSSPTSINLSWSDISYEENFVIERRNVTASTTFATIATTTANTVNYLDTGLSSGNTYSYRIRSYAGEGYSQYSTTTSTSL